MTYKVSLSRISIFNLYVLLQKIIKIKLYKYLTKDAHICPQFGEKSIYPHFEGMSKALLF